MPGNNKPGLRLKSLRQRLGVGQIAFAQALGVPQSNLSPWESGKREVPIPVLLAVCQVYGASRSFMLDGIGPMFEAERDLTGRQEIPDGGIYREELAGVIQAIRSRQTPGLQPLLSDILPNDRYRAILSAKDLPTFSEIAAIARLLKAQVSDLLVHPDGKPIVSDLSSVDPDQTILPRKPGPLAGKDLEASKPASKASATKPKVEITNIDVELRAIRKELVAIHKEIASLTKALAGNRKK